MPYMNKSIKEFGNTEVLKTLMQNFNISGEDADAAITYTRGTAIALMS